VIPLVLGLFTRFKWLKPLLIVIAVVGVVMLIAWAGAKVRQWKYDSDELAIVKPQLEAFEAAQAAANERVIEQAPIDEAERVALAAERLALETEKAKIARAWGRIRAVQEVPDEDGKPVVRLSDAWGVCFAAAAAGDPADAAACQASGGDGAVEERSGP
jgi:hypothetical protein